MLTYYYRYVYDPVRTLVDKVLVKLFYSEKKLKRIVEEKRLRHVGIIPDGNRRWSKMRGMTYVEGYQRALHLAQMFFDWFFKMNIKTFSFFWITTETWKRSESELDNLFRVINNFLIDICEKAKQIDVKIVHLGRKDRIPKFLVDTLRRVEMETQNGCAGIFNIAIDYGGVDEILRATTKLLKNYDSSQTIDKNVFMEHLDTFGQANPCPDVIIRSGKVARLSGFMLTQAAYSELFFPGIYFPDFSVRTISKVFYKFAQIKRTFGG